MSSLFVVNQRASEWLSFGVSALRGECHVLAVFRNDGLTLGMVLPSGLFCFRCERVGIYLFNGDGVPRCSRDGVLFAVVFDKVAGTDRSTVLSFPGDSSLNPAARCLIHQRQAFD